MQGTRNSLFSCSREVIFHQQSRFWAVGNTDGVRVELPGLLLVTVFVEFKFFEEWIISTFEFWPSSLLRWSQVNSHRI